MILRKFLWNFRTGHHQNLYVINTTRFFASSFLSSGRTTTTEKMAPRTSLLLGMDVEDQIKTLLRRSKVCIFLTKEKETELDQAISIFKENTIDDFKFYQLNDYFSSSNDEKRGKSPVNEKNQGGAKNEPNLNSVVDCSNLTSEKSNRIFQDFVKSTCRPDLPLIFVKGDCIGDVQNLKIQHENGFLRESLKDHDYDLAVIGGGSGGIAAARRACEIGKKVAVLDFVKPTPLGTTWGVGGTCVNVGCIPKKLMHQAALIGKLLDDAKKFGWQVNEQTPMDWNTLTTNIHNHILSTNFLTRVDLRQMGANYINGHGSFINSHTIKAVQKNGKETILTADKFLIATGVRPRYLDIPGAKEYCVTSDDLFTLPYSPGKTLVVGASYVALECAGFLHGLGYDVTVMVRSILLRGFDRGMAEKIGAHMQEIGIKFIREAIPTQIEKMEDGKPGLHKVTYKRKQDGQDVEEIGEYNTVLLAIGRDATTDDLNLEAAGVATNKSNKKIVGRENEQSVSAPHVYTLGDVLDGKPELTPVAIQAANVWAERQYEKSFELCDYINVPTTVFTPLEYGCCGYSEEAALEKFGDKAVIFHSRVSPVEFTVPQRKTDAESCYAKIIFYGDADKPKELKVIGLHYFGPNAGEVVQGFAIALKLGATLTDFKNLVGIHPTTAEVFTFLSMFPKTDAPLPLSRCCS